MPKRKFIESLVKVVCKVRSTALCVLVRVYVAVVTKSNLERKRFMSSHKPGQNPSLRKNRSGT